MEINAKKILITGANGFIGSHLTRRLMNGGNEVHILLREKSDTRKLVDILPRLNIHHGDITDSAFLKKLVSDIRPEGIFHLAASTIMSGVRTSNDELIRINMTGTANLIDGLDNVNYDYFINTGSFFEYGFKDEPMKELDICEPTELYSITKLAQTLYAQAAAKMKNKPIVSFRIFTPYGPGVQEGRLVYNVVYNALLNKDINLTKPSTVRDFIFVDDIVELYLEAAGKAQYLKGEIFNAGSGVKTSLELFVEKVMKITDSKSKVNWGAYSPVYYDSDMWQADMAKTFSKFIWRPHYDIDSGIKKTVDWFKEYKLKI